MFALCDIDTFSSVNLKSHPERAEELRAQYLGIKPGYHMNKKHWNSVMLHADIETSLLLELVDGSYKIVSTLNAQMSNPGSRGILTFEEDIFSTLTVDDAKHIISQIGTAHMMRLPKKEITFFEWLKEHHPLVWNDLWGNDDEEYMYTVGLEFLPLMMDPVRGFPICDLLTLENYFFVPDPLS